jgi:ADP-ribosylarginine hydrolase
LGGIEAIEVNPKNWMVSDDTVMHIATGRFILLLKVFTAEALVEVSPDEKDLDKIMKLVAKKYIACEKDFEDRAPGNQTLLAIELLSSPIKGKGKGKKKTLKWDEIPFAPKAGGCGGSMRAMCIGSSFFTTKYL